MQTKTLDQIVRNELANSQLTLHSYVPFLFYAINEVKKLSDVFSFQVSQQELTITNREAPLPANYRRVVAVSKIEGERLLPLPYDIKMNTDGVEYVTPDTNGYFGPSIVTDNNLHYTINETTNKIILSTEAGSNKHKLMLTYETVLFSTTGNTLVPIIFERVIQTSIRLQRAKNSRAERGDVNRVNEIYVIEKEYNNAKRILKTHLNPMTWEDIMMVTRKAINNSIKN
jgi:hypothetical protein